MKFNRKSQEQPNPYNTSKSSRKVTKKIARPNQQNLKDRFNLKIIKKHS